jgi:hypothetical protein
MPHVVHEREASIVGLHDDVEQDEGGVGVSVEELRGFGR